jgi:hypothetical protein
LRSAAPVVDAATLVVLPSSLQNIEVLAACAADYDTLLGGAS